MIEPLQTRVVLESEYLALAARLAEAERLISKLVGGKWATQEWLETCAASVEFLDRTPDSANERCRHGLIEISDNPCPACVAEGNRQ